MKIHIIHDNKGNVKSVAMPGKHPKFKSGIVKGKGEEVTEIDSKLIKKFDEKNTINIIKNFILDHKSKKPKLIFKKYKKK